MVERNLAKVEVESSRLFSRSIYLTHGQHEGQYNTVLLFFWALQSTLMLMLMLMRAPAHAVGGCTAHG